MYGGRNTHLIVYKNALDIALLFGVSNSGRILSPTDLGLATRDSYETSGELPLVSRMAVIDRDYVWNYEKTQKRLEEGLKKVEGEEHYTGIEGSVWYLHFPDSRCIQIKNKPETIESIHFASGKGALSKNAVLATAWNAFENMDIVTVEFVKQLLLEEFKPEAIEANLDLVERCVSYVNAEMEFRQVVLEEYKKVGMNILLNKREVMRALSEKFDRSKMGKVYAIVANYS
jgi:hypothetical protein